MNSELSNLHANLNRISGVCNLKQTLCGPERTALDFTLGFPEGRLVDYRRERSTGIGNSSFVLRYEDQAEMGEERETESYVIEEFLVRLPPLPKSEYTQNKVESGMSQMISELDLPEGVEFKVENEEKALWPHIDWRCGVSVEPLPPTDAPGIVRQLYNHHRSEYFDASKTV